MSLKRYSHRPRMVWLLGRPGRPRSGRSGDRVHLAIIKRTAEPRMLLSGPPSAETRATTVATYSVELYMSKQTALSCLAIKTEFLVTNRSTICWLLSSSTVDDKKTLGFHTQKTTLNTAEWSSRLPSRIHGTTASPQSRTSLRLFRQRDSELNTKSICPTQMVGRLNGGYVQPLRST